MNNAGIVIAGPIEWTPLERMKHIADVNLWGMIEVTKTFLPLIKETQGRVVNLSSQAGERISTQIISVNAATSPQHFPSPYKYIELNLKTKLLIAISCPDLSLQSSTKPPTADWLLIKQ